MKNYVLRIEIELPKAVDDVAAREQANEIIANLPPNKATFKLQCRYPDKAPRKVRL